MKNKIILTTILFLFMVSIVSSEVFIVRAEVGKPQIISVGQEVNSGEVILSIGIKNIAESEGGFRLYIQTMNDFRLEKEWYGTLEAGETKTVKLKLIGDQNFYGEKDYKIILEEQTSKEKDTYEDSFFISQKTTEEIPSQSNTTELKYSKINYKLIILTIILVAIGGYFIGLKSKKKN